MTGPVTVEGCHAVISKISCASQFNPNKENNVFKDALGTGSKKPDNVDRDYIVLLSNLIEEGSVQCIVEQLDLATGNTAGKDGDTLVIR